MDTRNVHHKGGPPNRRESSDPSLLVVEDIPDIRAFLRATLRKSYQVFEASTPTEVDRHLGRASPEGLVIGSSTAPDAPVLDPVHQEEDAPPILKLWTVDPPGEWASAALRHPFLRVDLLRAVDELLQKSEATPSSRAVDTDPNDLEDGGDGVREASTG